MKVNFKEIYPIIFITIIVFLSISMLAFTDSITRDMRGWQKEQKILKMLDGMYPEMSHYDFEDDIYIVFDDEAIVGYAYVALGKGYGGNIDILVGLENETTLRGISIIRHSETPGLGAKITENEYLDQFTGLDTGGVEMKYDGGQIDAITGATISSSAVVDAVRTTAIKKAEEIFERRGDQNE
ncbi:FMN-binding protein [Chloroflexota bacterium]